MKGVDRTEVERQAEVAGNSRGNRVRMDGNAVNYWEEALFVLSHKLDRHSLERNLPSAVLFARQHLKCGHSIFICCRDGVDYSVAVCLAILVSCFNDHGVLFGDSEQEMAAPAAVTTKASLRRRLAYLAAYDPDARPCRGNLKQVYHYLSTPAQTRHDHSSMRREDR
ncbi:hypothetical protein CBR_g41538 [Chara braunii]|uniref:Rit1 DUSP-like domain-containing protein n=1 Tax=Chara braunii TaxID=69332 RepID=A0A388K2T6_CHABU|nr:hypothetical protein CBR_g41538 [Chara braunii]|eukprot:GBG64337.1 hypothetical protein CBR_g41538 [Chara braunii]